jgi:hypothetical protein
VGVPEVIAGLLVVTGVVPGAQPVGVVMVLVSRVTAPLLARSRPTTLAPVVAVTDCLARMVPWNWAALPRVAELPTSQNTLQADAPPVKVILVPDPMVRVLAAWNTHTDCAVPASVRAPLFDKESVPPE